MVGRFLFCFYLRLDPAHFHPTLPLPPHFQSNFSIVRSPCCIDIHFFMHKIHHFHSLFNPSFPLSNPWHFPKRLPDYFSVYLIRPAVVTSANLPCHGLSFTAPLASTF